MKDSDGVVGHTEELKADAASASHMSHRAFHFSVLPVTPALKTSLEL